MYFFALPDISHPLTSVSFSGSATTTTRYSFPHTGNNSQLVRHGTHRRSWTRAGNDDSQLQDRQLVRCRRTCGRFSHGERHRTRKEILIYARARVAWYPVIRSTLNDEGLPFSRTNLAHGTRAYEGEFASRRERDVVGFSIVVSFRRVAFILLVYFITNSWSLSVVVRIKRASYTQSNLNSI